MPTKSTGHTQGHNTPDARRPKSRQPFMKNNTLTITCRVLIALSLLVLPRIIFSAPAAETWTRLAFLSEFGKSDEATELLREVLANPTYNDVLNRIRLLGSTTTETTRAALLRIAYGDIGPQYVVPGARAFVRSLTNQSQARALLIAPQDEAIEIGFRALVGQPLGEALLARAAMGLTNDSIRLREVVACLLQADTNTTLAAIKTELLASSMKSTLECTDANQPVNLTGEAFFDDARTPYGEWSLREQACLLGKTKGVTVQMIREALGAERGVVRDFTVLAMAYASTPAMQVATGTVAERKAALTLFATNDPSFFRGDQAVCAELYGVLTNSPNLTARFSAMSFLSWRPQQCDRAALDWVAKHDPFKSRPSPRYFMMPDADRSLENRYDAMIFPLRILAEQSLRVLDARTNPPPTGP